MLDDGNLRTAFADFFRVDARRDRARRPEDGDGVGVVLLRILRRRHRPRRLRRGLDGRGDNAEHVVRASPAAFRQPLLLQATQRYRRRRVAAEQRQLGAAREQVFDTAARIIDDLFRWPVAVGHVRVVSEIDEVDGFVPLDEGAQDGKSAEARIKNADHGPSVCDAGRRTSTPAEGHSAASDGDLLGVLPSASCSFKLCSVGIDTVL